MGADKQRQSSRHHYNKQHLKPLETMVKTTAISQCNERFAKENNADLVCVFAGATSGSGAGALEAMVGMLHTSTFYIIGRSAAQFASQRKKLEKINPNCKLEFLKAQVSLLSDVDEVCKQIVAAEKMVDLLFMSPGCIPFGGPRCVYIPPLNVTSLMHVQIRKRASRPAFQFLTIPGCALYRTFCLFCANLRSHESLPYSMAVRRNLCLTTTLA